MNRHKGSEISAVSALYITSPTFYFILLLLVAYKIPGIENLFFRHFYLWIFYFGLAFLPRAIYYYCRSSKLRRDDTDE
jgi:hypothetical protein